MTWVATAIGGSAVVGLGVGYLGAQAAGDAADTQAASAQQGIDEQGRQFDITNEQMAPFRQSELESLDEQKRVRAEQMGLLGIGTDEQNAASMANFASSPGQEFMRDQQERSLLRNASAIGGLGGGNIRTALQQQAFGRAQTDFGNRFSRLGGLSGRGMQATQQTGQFGANASANIGNLMGVQGSAQASGILGQQQAIAGTANNLTGLAGQAGLFNRPPQTGYFPNSTVSVNAPGGDPSQYVPGDAYLPGAASIGN